MLLPFLDQSRTLYIHLGIASLHIVLLFVLKEVEQSYV